MPPSRLGVTLALAASEVPSDGNYDGRGTGQKQQHRRQGGHEDVLSMCQVKRPAMGKVRNVVGFGMLSYML